MNEYHDDGSGAFTDNTLTILSVTQHRIKVVADGFYMIRSRIYGGTIRDTNCEQALNGIDPDQWAPYTIGHQGSADNTFVGSNTLVCRLAAGQTPGIYMTVYQVSGSDKTLYGGGGNFIEIVGPLSMSDAMSGTEHNYRDGGP